MQNHIDICGLSCRVPGATSINQLKQLLFAGIDAVTSIPSDRWNKELFSYPGMGDFGRSHTFAAGVIENIWDFDPKPFHLSPREVSAMDPQQRLMLQLVYEALEDAGVKPSQIAGENVGVYVGISSNDYSRRLSTDPIAASDPYIMVGNALSIAANRISHAFDLRGPSMAIDTACSSSSVALDRAITDLESGIIDMAIVGGANILLVPDPFSGFSRAGMLSSKGKCQSFSANADGYVRAEGGAALVLTKGSKGYCKNTTSRARIKASGVNSDGRTVGIAMPSTDGQSALLSHIYREVGIDADQLLFVEAHGTGTQVGDPVEANALGTILGQKRHSPLPIGSIKSNLGHLEPASGVLGICKAVIALEEKRLPPSLHCQELNPNIKFDELNLQLAQSAIDLEINEACRYAGVSSFGFGGVNAHTILEVAPEPAKLKDDLNIEHPVLRVSSFGEQALRNLTASTLASLKNVGTDKQAALCNQQYYRRDAHPTRIAIINTEDKSIEDGLNAYHFGMKASNVISANSHLSDCPAVFVYSGNGSQYAGMCLASYSSDKYYAKYLDEVSDVYADMVGWAITDIMKDADLEEKLQSAKFAQPLLFADQYAQTRALTDRGFAPAAVLGHSGGEVAAACCSGAIPLEQALRTIYERVASQETMRGAGTMGAVQASADEVGDALLEYGEESLTIAAYNSPRSVTIVGPHKHVSGFLKWARKTHRWAGLRLGVDYPYHSPLLDKTESMFKASLQNLTPQSAQVPYYSSMMGELVDGKDLDVDYWWNLIRNPVQFHDAMMKAADDGYQMFVECGPRPVLLKYMQDCLDDFDGEIGIWNTLEEKQTSAEFPIIRALGEAVVTGAQVDEDLIFGKPLAYDNSLPNYQWDTQEIKMDLSETYSTYYGLNENFSSLLGREIEPGANIWTNIVDANLFPELAEHIIGGNSIMPGTGFMEMAFCAAQQALGSKDVELRDVDMIAPLSISQHAVRELRVSISLESSSLIIESRLLNSEDTWLRNFHCRIATGIQKASTQSVTIDGDFAAGDVDGKILYEYGAYLGLEYGDNFQQLSHVRILNPTSVKVFLKNPEKQSCDHNYQCLSPFQADAVIHGLLALLDASQEFKGNFGFVPIHCKRINLLKYGQNVKGGQIEIKRVGKRSILADSVLFNDAGEIIAEIKGLRLRAIHFLDDVNLEEHSFRLTAEPIAQMPQNDGSESFKSSKELIDFVQQISQTQTADEDDESYYLLEAIANSIAYECVSSQDGKDLELERQGSIHFQILQNLKSMLRSVNWLTVKNDTPVLVNETGLPNSSELIEGLLSNNPELIAECRLLLGVKSLFEHMNEGSLTNGMFRNCHGISDIKELEQATKTRESLFELIFRALANKHKAHGTFRVLQINPLQVGSVQLSVQYLQSEQLQIDVMQLDDLLSGETIQSNAPSNSVMEYDLIFIGEGFSQVKDLNQLLMSLKVYAKPSTYLLTFDAAPSAFNTLSMIGGHCQKAQSDSSLLDRSSLLSKQGWQELIQHSEIADVDVQSLPVEYAFANCCAFHIGAKVEEEDLSSLTTPPIDMASEDDEALLYQAGFEEDLSHEALLNLGVKVYYKRHPATQESIEADQCIVYFSQSLDDKENVQNLTARIMAFSKFISGIQGKVEKISCIIPNGANYDGSESVSPSQSSIWSLLRTVKNEYPSVKLLSLDIDLASASAWENAMAAEFILGNSDETELLIDNGMVHALRVERGSEVNRFKPEEAISTLDKSKHVSLQMAVSGGLESLKWIASDNTPLSPNQVEIEVEATGLNYRDVMWTMGLLPEEALENGLVGAEIGMECAGKICAIGRHVQDFEVGDVVMAVGSGCFASRIKVENYHCYKMPKGITTQMAAALPVAFYTAHYSIDYLARLRKGEKILIHGAAGGVGLAAIQVAKYLGAEIFATAGSYDKRALLETIGVDHILDSRSLRFENDILELTNGQGVDVVLNSLAGKGMETSLSLLKPFGRFLELGKQDFYANTKIGVRPLKNNITYLGIDVDQLLADRPDIIQELFKEIIERFEMGSYSALPYYTFEAKDTIQAFKFMQRSAHIGKVLISPPQSNALSQMQSDEVFAPSGEGTHLVVGGAGGLGLELVKWLSLKGAKHITILGRSKFDDVKPRLENLKSVVKASINYLSCDATQADDLQRCLSEIRKDNEIKGILNAVMYLEDQPLNELSKDHVHSTLQAKIDSTKNLDKYTREDALEYFILLSSVASLVGNQRQSAYVAANSYMEGLVRNRVAQGLPALAVGLGAINDVGYLKENEMAGKVMSKMLGDTTFSSRQAINGLEKLLSRPISKRYSPVVALTNMNWVNPVAHLKNLGSPTFKALYDLGKSDSGLAGNSNLRSQLEKMSEAKAEVKLVDFIRNEIAKSLAVDVKEVDIDVPISELGMDSLMGVELGLSASKLLGDDIPMIVVSEGVSVKKIASRLAKYIVGAVETKQTTNKVLSGLISQHLGEKE